MAEHLRAVALREPALRQIIIFYWRKAQKGFFMEEKAKVTATPTIAEKCGIKYKEVDGLFYPDWGESDIKKIDTVGRYGHHWMTLLMEHDRYLYNQYFLNGTLIWKAKDVQAYCWDLHDSMVEKLGKACEWYCSTPDFMETFRRNQELEATVNEIIYADLYGMIDYNKKMRLKAVEDANSQEAE